jgi:hypothetical protein
MDDGPHHLDGADATSPRARVRAPQRTPTTLGRPVAA